MSFIIFLASLPLPVLFALMIASFLFLFSLLFLVAFAPTASDRIVRFINMILEWYYQTGEHHPHDAKQRRPNRRHQKR